MLSVDDICIVTNPRDESRSRGLVAPITFAGSYSSTLSAPAPMIFALFWARPAAKCPASQVLILGEARCKHVLPQRRCVILGEDRGILMQISLSVD